MKCSVGDLAFINKALRPENVGKVVTCVKYLGYYARGDVIVISGEHFYAFDSDNYWLIEASALETQFGASKVAYSMDSWLTPIKPVDLSDEEEQENGLEVEDCVET
jgi:hypothetical protein